jgi:hypothetical protein
MPLLGVSDRLRGRRPVLWIGIIGAVVILIYSGHKHGGNPFSDTPKPTGSAATQLSKLKVHADGSMAAYDRVKDFGSAWADVDKNHCDTRNDILARDLKKIKRSGIHFTRGVKTSGLVQIDHVIPLGDAWVSGAAHWTAAKREQLANDPLNLLAVDGHNNEAKGDHTAAVWLPPAKSYACSYVARQIAVKTKYQLTISPAEHTAMKRVLVTCPGEDAVHG